MTRTYIIYLNNILKCNIIPFSTVKSLFYSLFTLFLVNVLTKLILIISSSAEQLQNYEISMQFPSTFGSLVLTVIFLPVYEEVVFRLFLDRKRIKILISFALALSIFITYLLLKFLYYAVPNPFLWFMVLPFLLSILIAGFMAVPFNKGPSFLSSVEVVIKQNFAIAYYGSAIAFSAVHIMFQTLYGSISVPIVMIMFCNYFFAGLVFAHLRISKGIIYSILLHAFMNLLVFFKGLG